MKVPYKTGAVYCILFGVCFNQVVKIITVYSMVFEQVIIRLYIFTKSLLLDKLYDFLYGIHEINVR